MVFWCLLLLVWTHGPLWIWTRPSRGFTLTHEAILSIFKDVCAIQIDDDVQFEVVGVADIRETDDYPGIRVSLKANYPPISVPLTVDVTTGDMITPREIEYTF